MAQPTQQTPPVQITKVTAPKNPSGPYTCQDSNGQYYSIFDQAAQQDAWRFQQSGEAVVITFLPGKPKQDGSGTWNPSIKGIQPAGVVAQPLPPNVHRGMPPQASATPQNIMPIMAPAMPMTPPNQNTSHLLMVLSYVKDLIVAGKLKAETTRDMATLVHSLYQELTHPTPVTKPVEPKAPPVQFASKPGGHEPFVTPDDPIDVSQIPF